MMWLVRFLVLHFLLFWKMKKIDFVLGGQKEYKTPQTAGS